MRKRIIGINAQKRVGIAYRREWKGKGIEKVQVSKEKGNAKGKGKRSTFVFQILKAPLVSAVQSKFPLELNSDAIIDLACPDSLRYRTALFYYHYYYY